MSNLPDQLQPRALCTLYDVVKRVPGYELGDDGQTEEILNDLIVQESLDFFEETGRREIVPMNADTVRTFDLTASNLARRQIRIGDAAAVTRVELFDYDETTSLGVIAAALYVLEPRIREDEKPIRRIRFPYRPGSAILLAPGRVIKVTATWGFPSIPQTVRRAVATLTLFRYLKDAASAGTQLADAANAQEFDLAASLRVALDVRRRLRNGPFA